jgi:hypothetical protein
VTNASTLTENHGVPGSNRGPATSKTPANRQKDSSPGVEISCWTLVRTFKARKLPDFSAAEARNRDLGLKGELLVLEHEKRYLVENGRLDLAQRVRHVSVIEGDGAGYDIESYTLNGETKYIEVKTTAQSVGASFYIGPNEVDISPNEVEFAKQHQDNYYLYRVYDYRNEHNFGRCYVEPGSVEEIFELTPTQYRAVRI